MLVKNRPFPWQRFGIIAAISILFAIGSVYLLDLWLQNVEFLGLAIPKFEMADDYLIAFIWCVALTAFIFCWPLQKNERLVVAILWIARCGTTLFFMLYYESYYGSLDSFGYLARGALGDESLRPGGGTKNVDTLVRLLNEWLPIFSSYHSLKVIFSLLGLIGVVLTYRAISLAIGKKDIRILWFLGLFPSILFWSSILGKDPLYFLGISVFLYGVVSWYKEKRKSALLILSLGVFLCSIVRIWAGPILLGPFLITELILKWRPTKKTLFKSFLLMVVAIYLIRYFSSDIDTFIINFLADNIKALNDLSNSWGVGSQSGSGQELPEFSNLFDLVSFLPFGIFTALFRPLPGEVNNMFGLLAGLENLFILIFLGFSLFKIDYRRARNPIILVCLLCIFFWSCIYAFISSQNLGSGFRFRLQVISIIFLLIFTLKSSDRAKNSI